MRNKKVKETIEKDVEKLSIIKISGRFIKNIFGSFKLLGKFTLKALNIVDIDINGNTVDIDDSMETVSGIVDMLKQFKNEFINAFKTLKDDIKYYIKNAKIKANVSFNDINIKSDDGLSVSINNN